MPIPNSEYILISFLNQLNSNDTYDIGVSIAGFKVVTNRFSVSFGIDAQIFNSTTWLLKCFTNYGLIKNVQITRFLIDRTIE